MKIRLAAVFLVIFLGACDRQNTVSPPSSNHPSTPPKPAVQTLADARDGFKTQLTARITGEDPFDKPPAGVFSLVHYTSPAGSLGAYLSPDPHDTRKHPAILWITGGDCNSIGDVWSPRPATNDQSASAYRKAGIVMMFPSLRGGNTNPGVQEKFLGEVDDVLAAADYLAQQPYVDPDRIYLGGHSTGGTLALLVAETSSRFRATFSFGPVGNPVSYGPDFELPFDRKNAQEVALRSPQRWLSSIQAPTFVIEGERPTSNVSSLRAMAAASKAPQAHFIPVPGVTHFSVLGPANTVIAKKILADTGETCSITLSSEELAAGK